MGDFLRFFVRSVLPVGLGYVFAFVGAMSQAPSGHADKTCDSVVSPASSFVVLAILTTIVNAPGPTSAILTESGPYYRLRILLSLLGWYSVPAVLLGFFYGWMFWVPFLINVTLAKKGTRSWVVVAYGSTAISIFCYFLFMDMNCVVAANAARLSPHSVLAVIIQVVILSVIDVLCRSKLAEAVEPDSRGNG